MGLRNDGQKHREAPDAGACGLCGEEEDSLHLILECGHYSHRIWELFDEMSTVALRIRDPEQARINLTNFQILYVQAPPRMSSRAQTSFSMLVEEIKRFLVLKRVHRSLRPGLNRIVYDEVRLLAHLSIVVWKVLRLREYQGKDVMFLNDLARVVGERIDALT